MTTKSNFTPEQVATLAAGYDSNAPENVRRQFVADQAEKMEKSSRQIIGKLSTMQASHGVTYTPYEAKAPKARKATNMEIVTAIAANIGANVDTLASLERSSKAALQCLLDATTPAVEEVEAEAATD